MKWAATLLFWIVPALCYPQEFELTSVNLTVQDGLAGDNVYCAMQDDRGYIWFATETGVSRYNGREFQNYYTSDGLGDNEIFRIDQDSQGRIWFSAFNGKLSYFYQNRFHQINRDSLLGSENPGSYYVNFFEDSRQNLWLANRWGFTVIKKDGTLLAPDDFPYVKDARISIFKEIDGEVWGASVANREIYQFTNSNGETITRPVVKPHDDYEDLVMGVPTYLAGDHKVSMSGFVKSFAGISTGTRNYSKMHDFSDGFLWVCSFGGAFRVDISTREVKHYFKGRLLSHVLKDRENGFWFATLGEGVFYVPSLQNTSLRSIKNVPLGNTIALHQQEETLWFGGADARFGKIDPSGETMWTFKLRDGRSRIRHIYNGRVKGELLLVAEEALFLKSPEDAVFRLNGSVKVLSFAKDGQIIFGTYAHLFEVDSVEMYEEFYPAEKGYVDGRPHFQNLPSSKRLSDAGSILDIEPFQNGFLVGTAQGLYRLAKTGNYERATGAIAEEAVINDILVLDDHSFLLATSGSGTILFRGSDRYSFTMADGLTSDIHRRVFAENDSTFWIATNKGVNRVLLKEELVEVTTVKATDGLISEEVNDVLVDGTTLIAATSKGISRISIADWERDDKAPLINLQGMFADGKRWNTQEALSAAVKSINFVFDGLHFKSLDRLNYQYRLLGFDDSWRTTDRGFIEFSGLRSGEYTIELKAISATGKESPVLSQTFVISGLIWTRWWFVTLALLLVVGLVYLMVIEIIKRNRLKEQRKYELQLRIAEAERKALQSQLNPHFIFNSLNSIQNMVLDNNTDEVYQYLAKFGKLIRRVLEFSDISLISLADELETLRLYMELENLRLNDKFDFSIELAEDTDPMTEVPSMILQPHVENAIWHGITPLKGKRRGHVSVSASETREGLRLEVVDNGVGRQIKADGSPSFGTRIVSELVGKYEGKRSGQVEIVDLYEEGSPTGTKVIIQFLPEMSI